MLRKITLSVPTVGAYTLIKINFTFSKQACIFNNRPLTISSMSKEIGIKSLENKIPTPPLLLLLWLRHTSPSHSFFQSTSLSTVLCVSCRNTTLSCLTLNRLKRAALFASSLAPLMFKDPSFTSHMLNKEVHCDCHLNKPEKITHRRESNKINLTIIGNLRSNFEHQLLETIHFLIAKTGLIRPISVFHEQLGWIKKHP